MSEYEQIEGPLNQLARALDKSFCRRISVTTEVKDISVRKRTVRIHPEQIQGSDLFSLLQHVIELSKEYDNFRRLRREDAICEARKIAAPQIEYLVRHDPDVAVWLASFLNHKKEESNGEMQTSDSPG